MADINGGSNAHAVAVADLKSFVQRIQNLEDQKAEIAEDIKSVKAEAKAKGYDNKALGIALSLLKKDEGTLGIVKVYADALDIFG
jgi:uncharacterized protein (UPF0335 family)